MPRPRVVRRPAPGTRRTAEWGREPRSAARRGRRSPHRRPRGHRRPLRGLGGGHGVLRRGGADPCRRVPAGHRRPGPDAPRCRRLRRPRPAARRRHERPGRVPHRPRRCRRPRRRAHPGRRRLPGQTVRGGGAHGPAAHGAAPQPRPRRPPFGAAGRGPDDGRGHPGGPARRPAPRAHPHRVRRAALPAAQVARRADQGADPRRRLAVRLRRPLQRGRAGRQLLRRKLEATDGGAVPLIHTVRGVGYVARRAAE